MKVITYYKYRCDGCRTEHKTEAEALRCESIHGEKSSLSSDYIKRMNDNIHLWDKYNSVNFFKNPTSLKVTPEMLFLTESEISSSMTRFKTIFSRIKKLTKNNFEMNCTYNNVVCDMNFTSGSTHVDARLIFEVDCKISEITHNIQNYSNINYEIVSGTGDFRAGICSMNYYNIHNRSTENLYMTKRFAPADIFDKDDYSLILKEKLKGNLTRVFMSYNEIYVYENNKNKGRRIK